MQHYAALCSIVCTELHGVQGRGGGERILQVFEEQQSISAHGSARTSQQSDRALQQAASFHVESKRHRVQGRGGGERILQVFEEQLPGAMNAQPFQQLLSVQSVKRIIQARPHSSRLRYSSLRCCTLHMLLHSLGIAEPSCSA